MQRIVYRASCTLVRTALKYCCGVEVTGAGHVPKSGPCIVAANHASFLDPPLIAASIPHRCIRYMARSSLMKSALGRWYFSAIQIVPVDRDRGDVAAMKGVLRALKQGHCVALFPEGTRSYDGELQPAKRGIGFMVIKAGVCVVPMYVDGTHEALPRGASRVKRVKLRTIVGEPIAVEEFAALGSGKEAYGKAADLVMERIRALKPG